MIFIAIVTALALILSLILDQRKTKMALKKGLMMFVNILFPLLSIIAVVSLSLAFIPKETIVTWLGSGSGITGFITAALIGSVSLIPGFVAFPLCGSLAKMGVGYQVLAVFITTLMMVGIFTLPFEAKFFGMRTAIIRNLMSFIAALIIGISMGALWSLI